MELDFVRSQGGFTPRGSGGERFDFTKIDKEEHISINQQKTKWCDSINHALDLTERFIIKHGLILTGGLAIHYALLLKGHKGIYPPDEQPDWDCLSNNHQQHAFDLAEILCKEKLPQVVAIVAFHIITMKTRIYQGIDAMDVSYVPDKLFKIIQQSSLTYKNNLKLRHPHFQMLDQHRSLCLPFENEPMYTIDFRWAKDMIRYDILYSKYPLKGKLGKIKYQPVTFDINASVCYSGITGMAYWLHKATTMGLTSKIDLKWNITSKSVTYQAPVDHIFITTFDDDICKTLKEKTYKKIKYYDTILGNMPRRAVAGDLEMYDNMGQKLSCYYDANDLHVKHTICIANLQNIMFYLLERYLYYDIFGINVSIKHIFASFYLECHDIISQAASLFKTNPEFKIFLPTDTIYGKKNITENFKWSLSHIKFKLGIGSSVSDLKPRNTYPKLEEDCITDSTFNYKTSPLFNISGNETIPFI